jgi:hypothetical protein
MHEFSCQRESSWFRSAAGRRYGLEFALIVAIKFVLLALLYWLFIAPQPRADTSVDALRERMLGSAPAAAHGDSP